ncbi:alpha-N-acetylgalactosaminide alpha-2,6-sialyltransferase 1-like isoform X3 [Hippocampus comes]|uniref:alpha-N-acetylgalactosaminide alpha-2,6-sialyltransferase 1-like isoform X3 n=1 Tax=Hippocampus comes TaxID=109280 RepID=UPI00094E1A3E|nr:PREDICTED: alpha-N-acetylgalactosaminide alpha-2,6-sialyltransferase 1-like isoform X3 [Hippocampus comes]
MCGCCGCADGESAEQKPFPFCECGMAQFACTNKQSQSSNLSSRAFTGNSMTFHTSKICAWLFVIGVGIVFFVVFQENLTVNKWITFSGNFDTVISKQDYEEENATGRAILKATGFTKSLDSLPVIQFERQTEITFTPAVVPETPIPILFVANFSRLPVWDFEDVYNQDAPPGNRRCPESLRNSKDENFKKAFLPNIRLFMHNSINMSEWNRLSHFNNPFGFMEYSYDDIMSSVKLIPKPREPLLSPKVGGDGCIRCAVVGSGGILNGSNMGKEIDAHDYVFRVNAAITKGYEDDVGEKTSVYVHTAHSLYQSTSHFVKTGQIYAPHDQGIKYVMIPEGMRDFQWLQGLISGEKVEFGPFKNKRPQQYYAGQYNKKRFYVLHQDFLRYVRNRFLNSPSLNKTYWAIVRPTNGAFAVFLALHTCDIVDVYGFMTTDYAKYPFYYFQKHVKGRVILYINHDFKLETKTWENLHNSKIIRLYQGKEKEPPPKG